MTDFDQAVAFLGNWGLFQKIIFIFFCLSMVPNGFSMGIVFVADTPKHQCFIPQANLTQEWLQAVIPVNVVNGVEEPSRCSRYRLDAVMNLSAQGFVPGDVILTELQQEPCVDGWSYSKDIYQSTLVTEFDLVCSNQWKQPFTMTIYFIGFLFGSFILGPTSDRFGRKPVFFSTIALQVLFMFCQTFSTSWMMFAILMFFSGLGNNANYVSAYVAGAEILTGTVRVLFLTLGVGLAYSTGYLMVPLIAYFLRDWKSLQIAIALPGLLYLPFWWLIPESPRWLLSQGRVEEAEAIVRKAARMNKVMVSSGIFEGHMADDQKTGNEKHHTMLDLFRTSNIRTATLIFCLLWISMSAGYYGVSLNTSRLTPDPYLGSFISAVVELPSNLCVFLSLKYIPRRVCTVTATMLSGICLLSLPTIPQSMQWLSITLEMIGKFCFSASTNILYAYTAEVFPTVLRNTATGLCSASARIGSCVAPFIIQLSLYFTFLPPVVLGTLSTVSAIGALFLPETFKHPLPDTIQDMRQCERIKCPCMVQSDRNGQETTPDEKAYLESKL